MVDISNFSRDGKIVAALVAFLLIPGLIYGAASFTGMTFSLFGSTLCVDGVSDVNIDNSAYEFEDNQAWKISTTTGCNDLIMGGAAEIDEEDLQDGDLKAEAGFEAGMTDIDAWFYNEIDTSNSENIYDIEVETFECDAALRSSCVQEDRDEVEDWQRDVDYWEHQFTEEVDSNIVPFYGNDIIIASRAVKTGDQLRFGADQGSDFEAELTMKADGQTYSEQITKDKQTVMLGEGPYQARVTHTGSLIGDIRSIDLNDFTPVSQDGNVMVTLDSQLQDHRDNVKDVQNCLSRHREDPDSAEAECSVHSTNVYGDHTSTLESRITGFNADVQLDDLELRVHANDANVIERIGLDWTIDTAWIGINEQVPQPSILNTEDFEIEENDRRTLELPVRNDGEGAYIQARAECDSPISGDSERIWVAQGQTERFNLDISSDTGEGSEYNCDVEAQASDQPMEVSGDTDSFAVTLVEQYSNGGGDDDNGGTDGGGGVVQPPEPTPIPWGIIAAITTLFIGLTLLLNREKIREVLNQ